MNATLLHDILDRIPGRKPLYCRLCCRLLYWYLNPQEKQEPGEPRTFQSVCCERAHYEREVTQ